MAKEYDLVVLGGGTGGYVAALRASRLGMKTAVVEKHKLGGTCLHSGCIPTKALLRSAEVYRTVLKAGEFGVGVSGVHFQFSQALRRKEEIIERLHNGVERLLKKGAIDVYRGTGRILGPSIFSPLPGTIAVEMEKGENEMLLPKFLLLATGSRPRTLPGTEPDGKQILDSESALSLEKLPESILIVGGGAIGVEWASLLADFGTKVTLIEQRERILPDEDGEVGRAMERALKRRGVTIRTGAVILPETLEIRETLSVSIKRDGEIIKWKGEKMLLSVGRKPATEGIGLENTAIETDRGFIRTDPYYRTKEPHIYAIGDCIGGFQLAHVAMREGIIAVEHMAGLAPEPLDEMQVPRCIYAHPEAAFVGLSEQQAREKGFDVQIVKFPFSAIGKALIRGEGDGFVKMVMDRQSGDLLGVHLIGPHATELISEAGLALSLNAIPWEIGTTPHPHPSLSEIYQEAALLADGNGIHL
jgi:dihydrolipoamide dehydrogenase (EC 1.8.1.4)